MVGGKGNATTKKRGIEMKNMIWWAGIVCLGLSILFRDKVLSSVLGFLALGMFGLAFVYYVHIEVKVERGGARKEKDDKAV